MKIQYVCGIYYAMMRNPNGPGGFIANGKTRIDAMRMCLFRAGYFTITPMVSPTIENKTPDTYPISINRTQA